MTAVTVLQRIVTVLESDGDLTSADRLAAAHALRRLVQPSERYDLIREAVETLLSHERRPAKVFAQRLATYAGRAWLNERDCHQCPPQRIGKLEGYCWRILKIRDRTLTERQVRRVLDISNVNEAVG
jgi:hypothetical protein